MLRKHGLRKSALTANMHLYVPITSGSLLISIEAITRELMFTPWLEIITRMLQLAPKSIPAE